MKLSPATFWSLSLVEWRALLAPLRAASPLARGDLQRMMKEFPD